MCGIFGYVGAPIDVDGVVLAALRSMEYRGYDSWGVAYVDTDCCHGLAKATGRVPTSRIGGAHAIAAVGHTRWATHGEVSERNAHPHLGCGGRLAVVHNGIIENAEQLRTSTADVPFVSDTDTEVFAHLVARGFGRDRDLVDAVESAVSSIEGSNAFVVLDRHTGEIAVWSRRLPIRLGVMAGGMVLASDLAALAGLVDTAIALPEESVMSLGSPRSSSQQVQRLFREAPRIPVPAPRATAAVGPGQSMRAEIAEQPQVVHAIESDKEAILAPAALARHAERILFTGCGSAYHAGLFGVSAMQRWGAGIEASAIPASELASGLVRIRPGDLVIALTQSGETADVIDAITAARDQGATTVGFINAAATTIERMVDIAVPLLAGHERSVLATKSYMAMLARCMQLAAEVGESLHDGTPVEHTLELTATMDCSDVQRWTVDTARSVGGRSSMFILSTQDRLAVAREAALKIKEGSYVHAEAILAGELKHGVIALIDAGFPCLIISSTDSSVARLSIAAEELRSRGADVRWLGPGAPRWLIESGAGLDVEHVFAQTAVTQLVALETAILRGVDPDYPRNLAKSVTVR